MKFEIWPEEAQLAWGEIMRSASPFDKPGRGSHWSPGTTALLRMVYGRWLSFLATTGCLETGKALWVRPETVSAFLASLNGLADYTVLLHLAGLLTVSRAMAPDDDWDWLQSAVNRLRQRGPRGRSKHARLKDSADLFEEGLALMDEAGGKRTPLERAVAFRDGLMMAVLAARPLRCRNFAMVELGRHLLPAGGGWRFLFAAAETKSRRPIDLPWPDRLILPLQLYLDQHRPILLGENVSDRLWISREGRPINGKRVHALITTITRRHLGQPINPHLFRDCLATSIAIRDPEHIGAAAVVLTHSQRTNEKHYNQAQTLEAGRLYQQGLVALRKRLAPERRDRAGRTAYAPTAPDSRSCRQPPARRRRRRMLPRGAAHRPPED